MRQPTLIAMLAWLGSGLVASPAAAQDWSVTANVAEVCSCAITCPCNFGGEPSREPCEGNRLIEITDGHYGDTSLNGVTFVVTFGMREWSKIYVSDNISAAQMEALDALLPRAFGGFHRNMLALSQAPVTVTREGDQLSFSTPESAVVMETLRGLNDEPITIDNLPSPVYHDYTQQISIVHEHDSGDKHFSYSGTTGFRSRMEVSGR
jgi:hypothetical protein